MLIFGSHGFIYESVRTKIAAQVKDFSGRLLIIPLACMFPESAVEKEREGAVRLGYKRENIDVFDEARPDTFLNRRYDAIAVLGGNTFQLLYKVRQYGLERFIRQQITAGAHYFGFSAGAYLACRNIEYVKFFDDNNHIADGCFDALGLTESYFLCHFDYRSAEEIKMCRSILGMEPELITIGEDEVIVQDG